MYFKSKSMSKKFVGSIILLIISIVFTTVCITGCGATKLEDYSYSIENNVGIIKGYLGPDTNIIIPDKIEGSKVTTIGKDAFADNDVIESIEIPDSVITLEDAAIHDCENLSKITMSDNLYNTYIQDNGDFSDTIYGCPFLYINGVLMDDKYGSDHAKKYILKQD
ncbi:MAG: leucine-rich repeat protein [Ruminococcus sp.]